jgi:hypothetical protein
VAAIGLGGPHPQLTYGGSRRYAASGEQSLAVNIAIGDESICLHLEF